MANNNSTSNVQRWFFIAEKPSLMREVQKCYRNHQKDIINKVGSIDFIALAGHVCGSFFPDDYKNHPEWSGKWDEIDYPIIPQQWGIKALDDKRKKETLKKIKSLVSEYDGIIVGTDSDTEGYGIYYLLEHYLKIEKKKALRFIEHSLTDKEIYEQLLCMRDYHTDPVHKHFTESFLIRMRTDWLFGMNVTRLMTNKCGVLMNTGRVKAATTKLIYDNSMAIDHFVSRTYYYLTADYGNFKASQIDKHGKYVEYATADEVKKQSVPLNGKVLKKDVKDEYTNAPQLYDLSAIQVEAGRLYKMSPKEVLATIQSLYETHKVISYPRTQCRYVSSEKAKEFPDMLKKLLVFPELKPYVEKISVNDIKRVQADKRIVNDKEVEKESHDALLPTDKTPDLCKLSEIERQICLLIYTRLLAQFLPKLRQQKTKLFLQHGDKLFYTTGKMVIDEGWRKLYGSLKNIELPLLTEGQSVTAKEIVPDAKKTTPPKRYTDASIVDAMTNIANQIKDDALRKSLSESKGIGTSATRAQIIDEIIKAGYVDVKKKQLYITEKGKRLIESFPGIDLFKPEFSAVMDYDMKLIQRGEKDYDTVYADTLNKLRKTCEQIEQTKVSGPVSKYKCPRCHSYMKEVSWGYVCDACDIKVPFSIGGHKFTESEMNILFEGEKTKPITLKKKDGNTFAASLILTAEQGVQFDFSSGVLCPYCKNDMRHNKGGYFCDCGFKVFQTICGKSLTDGQMKRLIAKGSLPEMDGFESKAGKKFSAGLEIKEKKVNFVFPEKRS